MKAPITPTQAWAVIAESAGWNAKELPVLPDHPEPRTMKWTAAEIEAIQGYGQQCAAHARELALSESIEAAIDVCGFNGVSAQTESHIRQAIEVLKGK